MVDVACMLLPLRYDLDTLTCIREHLPIHDRRVSLLVQAARSDMSCVDPGATATKLRVEKPGSALSSKARRRTTPAWVSDGAGSATCRSKRSPTCRWSTGGGWTAVA